jgi:ribonuclease D
VTNWIRSTAELEAFMRSIAGSRALAVDTESDSLYHHREKVCLVQLASDRGATALVDPLAFSGLAPLAEMLTDPGVVIIFHAADNDIATMKRDFGVSFSNVFDTMIAARFLGATELGLQGLLQRELGVTIAKGGQKDDWSRRPLRPDQEAYALADVTSLVALAQRLGERLLSAGRLAWVREECDAVAARPAAQRRVDPAAFLHLKGASDLSRRGLAVLRELHAWREGRAESTDRPPFKILAPTTLIELARQPPQSVDDLAKLPETAALIRSRDEILAAVARGLAVPEDELPRSGRGERPRGPGGSREHVAALKALRVKEGARLGLDPALILPQRLIDAVAVAAPRSLAELQRIDGLRHWRITTFGRALLVPHE